MARGLMSDRQRYERIFGPQSAKDKYGPEGGARGSNVRGDVVTDSMGYEHSYNRDGKLTGVRGRLATRAGKEQQKQIILEKRKKKDKEDLFGLDQMLSTTDNIMASLSQRITEQVGEEVVKRAAIDPTAKAVIDAMPEAIAIKHHQANQAMLLDLKMRKLAKAMNIDLPALDNGVTASTGSRPKVRTLKGSNGKVLHTNDALPDDKDGLIAFAVANKGNQELYNAAAAKHKQLFE